MPAPRTHAAKVLVVLTARCNMACGYCYQGAKSARRMMWETLEPALDLAMASTREHVEIVFYGGEPLLELPLIRRAVEYVNGARPVGKTLAFGLVTNGTLLRPEAVGFLAEHAVDTQWSMDGVREAQDLRGRGTFSTLDRRLDEIRRDHPLFLYRNVTVSVTVPAAGIPYLADSFDYFMEKGIGRITISPVFTHEPGWKKSDIRELRRQFASILRTSLAIHAETGAVPYQGFQGKAAEECGSIEGLQLCGAGRGDVLVVDPEGSVHGCATWIDSEKFEGDASLRSGFDRVRLGLLTDPEFARRYAAFPRRVRRMKIVNGKESKHSSYGKCAECRFLSSCSICPTSIAHIPGNADPDRVPDFPCAFNLVALEARERFRRRARLQLRPGPALSLAFWTDRPRPLERREPHA